MDRSQRAIAITQIIANIAVAGSLVFTGFQLHQSQQATYQEGRFQSWLDLFRTFDEINDYIAEHATKPPLYPEFKSDRYTSTLLFHHLNLAFRAWLYHRIGTVTDEEFSGFQNWTDKVVFPWLENEPCVAADMNTILTFGDLYPAGFLQWFKSLPGYGRAIRRSSQCGVTSEKR